ncbi:MAG: SLBB domain-containing protein, partial [bacterium]|nr:SLBB domain-containing protein [bacterium]
PEGKLVIQSIGIYEVAGKTLHQVQQLVLQEGEKKYKLKKIFANLIELRRLRVHVVGEIEFPGIYLAQPVDRISMLLEKAGSLTDWADQRRIIIKHVDGTSDTLDFYRYTKYGELDQNIFVQDGDIIYVPIITASQPTVTLEGSVKQPGVHTISAEETLNSFVSRIKGFNRTFDPTQVQVVRLENNGQNKLYNINLIEQSSENSNTEFKLQDGDKIYIPSFTNKVYVYGAVNLPGGYNYMAGSKAKDYVGLAGGTMEMGSINKIKVIHARDNSEEYGPDVIIERGDMIFVPKPLRRNFIEYLQIITSIATLFLAYRAAQR